jgi:hypothetical protein
MAVVNKHVDVIDRGWRSKVDKLILSIIFARHL